MSLSIQPRSFTWTRDFSRPTAAGLAVFSQSEALHHVKSEKFRRRRLQTVEGADLDRILQGRTYIAAPLADGDDLIKFVEWDDKLASDLGSSVHYKGFAARIDFLHEDTEIAAQKTLEFVQRRNPDTLVWDGDSYAEDSFTYLIPRIWNERHPGLVMFLRDTPEERQRVIDSWEPLGLPITCYLCSGAVHFEDLGEQALRATHSCAVICFGGGDVVRNEFSRASDDVDYLVMPVVREKKGCRVTERGALESQMLHASTKQNLLDLRTSTASRPRCRRVRCALDFMSMGH